MSERRACKAIGCCRMTIRYRTTRADDAALRQRMRAIAEVRRRCLDERRHAGLARRVTAPGHPADLVGDRLGCSAIESRSPVATAPTSEEP